MPVGKSRNSKRSATTSYTSTITTVIFIALCVVGVWMLTSNSLVPPEPTAKTSTRTTVGETNAGTKSRPQKPEKTYESSNENNEAQFEDNPGKLPDDAIKTDEVRKSQSTEKEVLGVEEHGHGLQGIEHAEEKEKQKQGETQLSEESVMTQSQETEHTVTKNDDEDSENSAEKKSENEKEESNTDSEIQNQEEKQTEKAKEYEKEQREQREEDAGNPKNNEEQREEDAGNPKNSEEQREQREEDAGNPKNSEEKTEEEDKQNAIQQNEQEKQETEEEQKQESNTEGTTFTDSTREEQPTDQGFSKEATETDKSSTKAEQKTESSAEQSGDKPNEEEKPSEESSAGAKTTEPFPSGGSSEIPKESAESKKSWKTQAAESKNEKKRQKDDSDGEESGINEQEWLLCNTSAGPDYIPCLDNEKAIAKLRSRRHFEHRERHCPEDGPMCLVPLPDGYKEPIKWPKSRDKIWYHNVPHTKLADVKGHQNWVKVTGEFLTFPGGGTQFIHGALHYIDFLQQSVPNIGWGKHSRVLLDVGCGVASFGGFLFERDVLAMSLAPKDEHEAQVQFALERGIPAISAVMGTQRLPFPSRVFDVVHCARCRVPWHNDGGMLLLELNRVLRPGGYFIWSATPVYQKLQEDQEIWEAMSSLTKSMCWELVNINKDKLNGVGAAIYRKPDSNQCYEKREQNQPPICKNDDDANAAWYVPLQACMHKVPVNTVERGSKWPENWPRRLQTPPYWLNGSQMGIYGKPAPQDFTKDNEHWKQQVSKVYMNELGINWSNVRNVMDMRAVYGGLAAALKDLKVWVMNVVNINSPDTLPIIFERGLFGIYHDWCESFSTYPRSYDLLHADHLISKLKERCKVGPVMAEVDRIVRPGGKLIVRDESNVIREVENLLKSLHWDVHLTFSKNHEGILSAQKGNWRPKAIEDSA